MNLKYGKQIEINEINDTLIDLFLFAGNHEMRVYTAMEELLKTNKISKSIMLTYNEFFVIKKGVRVEKLSIKKIEDIYDLLDKEFFQFKGKEINIVVDYSCMTKFWYYSIMLFFSKKNLNFVKLIAFFIYTPSKFSKPLPPKPNTEIAPLPGKYIVPTDKPKALIVCLGYEQNKAEGIIEHLDPKICYLFYTKPALDNKFVRTLELNNHTLITERSQNLITYSFNNLLELERKLTAVYNILKKDYSIIIAPLGPKPFTFISMMMSVKFNDIDIWRVGSGSDINEYKRIPFENKNFIISKVVYEN